MVNIPRANTGGVKMTTQAPRQKQSPQLNAMTARAVQGVGQQVQQLGQQMKDLQDLKDYTAAKTEATKVMLEAKKAAERDKTPWDMSERYSVVMEQGINSAMETIRNPKIREQFKQSMSVAMMKENYEIGKIELKAQFAEAKAVLEENMEVQKDRYDAEDTLKGRNMIEKETRAMVQAFVNKQGVHGEAANDMVEDQIEAMKLTAIDYDIQKDTENTILELQKGEDGKYKDVQAHVREAKLKEGEAKLRHDRSVAILMTKVGQEKIDSQTMDEYRAGTLSASDLGERIIKGKAGEEGGMTPGLGTAIASLMKANVNLKRTVMEKVEANDTLDELIHTLFLDEEDGKLIATKETTLESIAKYREAVIMKQAGGYITEGEAKTRLAKVHNIYEEEVMTAVRKRLGQEKGMWNGIIKFVDNTSRALFNDRPRWPEKDLLQKRKRDMVENDLRTELDRRLNFISPQQPLSNPQRKEIMNDMKQDYIYGMFPELMDLKTLPSSVYIMGEGLMVLPEVDKEAGEQELEALLSVDENGIYKEVNLE